MPIHLYTIVSNQFARIHQQWFLRTLAAVRDPGIKLHTLYLTAPGNGDFATPEYNSIISLRLDRLINWIDRHDGEILMFADSDIVWLKPFSAAVCEALEGVDVVYQSEGVPDQPNAVNGGLFAVRCSPAVRRFYEAVRDEIGDRGDLDQETITRRLPESELRWKLLPRQFANPNLMRGVKVEPDTICYHAINTIAENGESSLARKEWQFQAISRMFPRARPSARTTEIVVARYNEDLGWLNRLPQGWGAIVYDKSETMPTTLSRRLPNVGREAHTFAEHICREYDRLTDITVFSQGDPFFHCGQDFLDKLNWIPDGAEFVDLGNLLAESDHLGYPHHPGLPVGEIFRKIFPGRDCPPRLDFGCGAFFAASRATIQRYPLEWWQQVRDVCASERMAPWVLERMWPYLLGETVYGASV
jgi:hypothetical protein